MAVLGEPTAMMNDLLDEVLSVQAAARTAIRPGTLGNVIYETALRALKACSHQNDMRFVAHGIGLIAHEAPRLTATGPIPYADKHAQRPLEAGMVISVETHVKHPEVGFVKLEDTVAVTNSRWEAFGDWGRVTVNHQNQGRSHLRWRGAACSARGISPWRVSIDTM
jgi:Xaa-Pro aminopeptidase